MPKRYIEIDLEKYQKYIDDKNVTELQREEIVQALWSIIVNFVDLGFGVHPMQEVCGELSEEFDQVRETDSNELAT